MPENKPFNKVDFSKQKLSNEYDCCTFTDCNFENVKIGNNTFIECEFVNCNFSNTKLNVTSFKDVSFKNCKLMGINFNDCNPFLLHFSFTDCDLTLASFYQLPIKNTIFTNCNLTEVDFTETDLTNSSFNNCDFVKAIFENTNLTKVNLATSYNFSINPSLNNIKNAQFAKDNIEGLVSHLEIIIK